METATWENSRKRYCSYARRRPEETLLYRVVFHYAQELQYRWEELFQERYGALRDEVLEAFNRYLSCGVIAHGCARARCENCNHSLLIAFSCKRRSLCPSCDAKRAVIFAEHLQQNILLLYPHHHVVWSIPKRLRVYFRYDRALIKHLYTAAWNAWNKTVSDTLPAAISGAVMALHTAGDLLNFHPHVHSLCLAGGLDNNGAFKSLPAIDTESLNQRFADSVFKCLLDAELISQEVIDSMRSWEHSGFNVFVAEPTPPENTNARLFLARYLKRSPLSLERMSLVESNTEPVIRLVKKLADDEIVRDFSPLEFLAELQQHIPDIWEQTTRYYGCYAARSRGAKRQFEHWDNLLKPKAEILFFAGEGKPTQNAVTTESKPKASQTWAACIKRIYDVDPLICPTCGSQMKILAFLQNHNEIEKLARHLGYPNYRAPPPFPTTPTTTQLVFDDLQSVD